MTLGEIVVNGLTGVALLGVVYSVYRYDFLNPRDAPGYKNIRDALKYGKPLSSQWKPLDESNRAGYGIFALSLLAFGILMFAGGRLIGLIDRL
ncbi:MAG: hypothetical protein E5X80_25090 [Mesorhizobium sp.]|uniref:hypothetical protein n=1 Tax=Mesorhizobium sp. TaxID=1871066 RepID=UPI000FE70917|nr:hypothetical protein [Mesorhizobium sp.]RWM05679.1 MAG: hypothetical protein EOR71_23090 [Mesorhizobium sp.]TIO49389.1 MAG: hypothetical protein E5X78_26165 [Mesorhizobium sp.]TIO57341.1 MAG: hypothetical protein E5X79_26600 [Mesorhizobium sp.]TJV59782.1 MAG: hypothetical protein E5X80_25090 [Mesorhizobium sp.]